jgi:hypothetical protein
MKPIILPLIGVLGLMLTNATAQETMQFAFIGNTGGNHESLIITSAKDLKMNDVEVLLVDQRTFDTLKTYILRNYREKGGNVASPKNGSTDSLSAQSDIKVTGVDSMPLYFKKYAFSELVYSAMEYFKIVGLKTPTVNFVLERLRFVGGKRFFYRDFVDSPAHADPYLKLKDKPNM